jgi:hypothetical protein
MTEFNQLEATVKFNTVYVCACCGKRQVGTTVRMTYRGRGPDDLSSHLKRHRQSSADMPVGWSFDGKFKCAICCKET